MGTIVFLAFLGLLIASAIFTLYAYRPRDIKRPKTCGIAPVWTWAVAIVDSGMVGISIALFVTALVYLAEARLFGATSPEGMALLVNGAIFVALAAGSGIGAFALLFTKTTIAVGSGGAIKFLDGRIYGWYLKEGSHRLFFLFKQQPVDMTVRVKTLKFTEPTRDRVFREITILRRYSIALPAQSLQVGTETEVDDAIDGLIETAARDSISSRTTNDLDLPPRSKAMLKNGIAKEMVVEVLGTSCAAFLDPIDSCALEISIKEIAPTEQETTAAAKYRAQEAENKQAQLAIRGFSERIDLVRKGHPEFSPQEVANYIQAQEGKMSRSAFDFENLEDVAATLADSFGKQVVEALRALAHAQAKRRA
jgi:hypothetical protein